MIKKDAENMLIHKILKTELQRKLNIKSDTCNL
jgi:hypothetical protein